MKELQRGFAHILLLLVVVIVGIGAVGFYAYKNGQVKKEGSPGLIVTPTIAANIADGEAYPTGTAEADEKANWKTYRINELGLTFRLPEDIAKNVGDMKV